MALTTLTKIGKGITSLFKARGATHARELSDRFSDIINVKDYGAVGDYDPVTKTGTDNTQAFINAIVAAGGTYNLDSVFYQPAKQIIVPEGNFLISDTIKINKNNIRISGAGANNTTLFMKEGTSKTSIISFVGSYNSELSNISLEGGIRDYIANTDYEHGAEIGLSLDQCAQFRSEGLLIRHVRSTGIAFCHVWESYFEDTRIITCGFWNGRDRDRKAAGLYFTEGIKEEYKFQGAESNNITFNKLALSNVGSFVNVEAAGCANLSFNDIVGESQTWERKYETLEDDKFIFKATANGITINVCYVYIHNQPFPVAPVTLFNTDNIQAGVVFDKVRVLSQRLSESDGNIELGWILKENSSYPVEINVSIEDRGAFAKTEFIKSVHTVSRITGSVNYWNSSGSVSFDDFFDATVRDKFSGVVTTQIGTVSPNSLRTYNFKGASSTVSNIDTSGTYSEYPCRGWIAFNGVDGGLYGAARGVSVARTGVGIYDITFDKPLAGNNYAVSITTNNLISFSGLEGVPSNTGFRVGVHDNTASSRIDPTYIAIMIMA